MSARSLGVWTSPDPDECESRRPAASGPVVTRLIVTGGGLLAECCPCRVYLELGSGARVDEGLRAFADCHPPTLRLHHRKDLPVGWAARLAGALSQ